MNATVAHVEGRYRLLAIDDKCAQGIKKAGPKGPASLTGSSRGALGRAQGGGEPRYCPKWCLASESSGDQIDVCYLDTDFELYSGYHLGQVVEAT